DRGRGTKAEEAFRELVDRHGPMVLGICRQILRHHHDADDAFQATFLILVRKARSIRVQDSLAPWLSSVAFRTAQRSRELASRYQPIDRGQMEELSRPCSDEAFRFDVRPLLHEELEHLPGKFRDAIVLCHLEGKSHEEAARLLRSPIGTVNSRLSRGRRLLRSRLERRGVTVSAAILSVNWLAGTSTTLASTVRESTIAAAVASATSSAVPTLVLSLTRGVLRTMMLRKLRTISVAILLASTTGSVAVWAHWPTATAKAPTVEQKAVPAIAPAGAGAPKNDDGSAPPRSAPASRSQQSSDEVRLTDRPAGEPDFFPDYCPLLMAANALSRFVSHFHQASELSR
ncbi:MAG TPA: sigma-70 family RNA polymerase sigma factor, partial [Chloroflexota bacterium]|nr:sigma-70 family RNA polymerase sigma factor [Chloroflexota bacterium]